MDNSDQPGVTFVLKPLVLAITIGEFLDPLTPCSHTTGEGGYKRPPHAQVQELLAGGCPGGQALQHQLQPAHYQVRPEEGRLRGQSLSLQPRVKTTSVS